MQRLPRTLVSRSLFSVQLGWIQDQPQDQSKSPLLRGELGATLIELLWIYVWPNPGRVALHLHFNSALSVWTISKRLPWLAV